MLNERLPIDFSLSPELQAKLISTIVIIIFLWLLRLVALLIINHRVQSLRTQYTWRKASAYVLAAVGVLLIGRVFSRVGYCSARTIDQSVWLGFYLDPPPI